MLEQRTYIQTMITTVSELAKAENEIDIVTLLANAQIEIEEISYDNWNGGTYHYALYCTTDVKTYTSFADRRETIELKLRSLLVDVNKRIANEHIGIVHIVPQSSTVGSMRPDPHRPFTPDEAQKRVSLNTFLQTVSEDELIEDVLLPLFRHLGFHRITAAGHKDKALEYGKDIWMKYVLPTRHILYFGIQAKKDKLDAAGVSKTNHANIAEIYNQALMMIGHEIFDPELSRTVLVDHAFIVSGGEITKAARNWLGSKLDAVKRSQVMFIDQFDILNLFVAADIPLPSKAVQAINSDDLLPF
jgi:hypothetical protein